MTPGVFHHSVPDLPGVTDLKTKMCITGLISSVLFSDILLCAEQKTFIVALLVFQWGRVISAGQELRLTYLVLLAAYMPNTINRCI